MKPAPLLRSSIATFSVQVVGLAVGYTLGALAARILGPEAFGAYSYVFALITLATLAPSFGFPQLIVREVAGATVTNQWGLVGGLIRRAHQVALVGAALSCAALFGAFCLFPGAFQGVSRSLVLWAMIAAPLMSIAGLRTAVLRGLSHVALGTFPDQVLQKICTLLLLLALLFSGVSISAADLMCLHGLGVLVATVVGYLLLGHLWPQKEKVAPLYATKQWLRSILPLGLTQNMNLFNVQIGLIVLGIMGQVEEVANLRVANQIALFSIVVYGTINSVVYPRFSSAFKRNDAMHVEGVAMSGARVATLAAIAAVGIFALVGPEVVRLLFGRQYGAAVAATRIVLFCQVINAFFGFGASVLTAARLEASVTKSFAVSTGINVVLTPLLSWRFGAAGAATAFVVTTLVLNVALTRKVTSQLGIRTLAWGRLP